MVRERTDITNLTLREKEIMSFVVQGYSNKYIASALFISEQTVNNYLNSIYNKHFIDSGEKYNRRIRAVYIFYKNKRLELAFKILQKNKDIQKEIQKFEQWLQEESEE